MPKLIVSFGDITTPPEQRTAAEERMLATLEVQKRKASKRRQIRLVQQPTFRLKDGVYVLEQDYNEV